VHGDFRHDRPEPASAIGSNKYSVGQATRLILGNAASLALLHDARSKIKRISKTFFSLADENFIIQGFFKLFFAL